MNQLPKTDSRDKATTPGLKILLAEDHVLSQTMTVRLLQSQGHEVFAVGNGRDAVDSFREQAFDVVLMDLQLPVMDGLTAIRTIRDQNSRTRERPLQIWALSADSSPNVIKECLEAGADGHLAKPLSPRHLTTMLQDIFCGPKSVEISGIPVSVDSADHRQVLLENVGNDTALAARLILLFLADFESLWQRLHLACHSCDFVALGQEAHSLKSPARIFGAQRLHCLCDEVEQIAKGNHRDQLEAVRGRFLSELKALHAVLSQLDMDIPDPSE